jgi:hypothetical protein
MPFLLVLGVLLSLLSGCQCAQSHEALDSGPLPDASETRDTGGSDAAESDSSALDSGAIEGAFWTLEPANVDFSVMDDRCAATEGGTAVLHVQAHYFESCLSPAPIRATVDAVAHTITVRAFVWRDHAAACTSIGAAFERDVVVRDLTAGVWHVDDLHAGFDLTVDAPSPAACTALVPAHEGDSCFASCDCDVGLSCVAIEGDAVCASVCAQPCSRVGAGTELGLECGNDRECTRSLLSGFAVGTICTARTADLCSDAAPCPAGMACHADADAASYCEWTIELNSATRHTCTSDADCETPGLDCVHHPDGIGRCEVRCTTASMRCPMNAPHACNELGICEWLGE